MRSNALAYLMCVPGVVYLFLFCYLPMMYIVIAFKDYNVQDGIFGSPWAGLKNFEFFFSYASKAFVATINTVVLNTLFIISDVIFQMGFAILLNEIGKTFAKKVIQSILFFPFFLSWVVIGAIIYNLFSGEYGAINGMLKALGLSPVSWYSHPEYWKAILVGTHVWRWTGYGSLIYMAAMAGFDTSCYEAAIVDGASKIQQIRYITIPMLMPTTIILVLFAIGRIFYGDFGMVYGIVRDVGPLLQTTEVIDTYVYRAMRQTGDFSLATAIGIYQSIVGFIIVLFSNRLSKRLSGGTSLF
jgi:putative aldouronate transport system permease protein